MDQQTYDQRVKAFLADMNGKGVPPEVAAQSLASMEQADKSAAQQGVAFKSEGAAQPSAPLIARWVASDEGTPVFTSPDGTQGLIVDGRFIALKAAEVKADMPPAEMVEAGEAEMEDGEVEEAEAEGEYVGDMTPAAFFAQLQQVLAPVLKMQEMVKTLTDMGGEMKAMYATKDASPSPRLDALEQRLAQLAGDVPAVVDRADVEAALKGAPQAPPDPNALPAPENAIQAAAMRTFPDLYRTNPQTGAWAGWQPQTLPPSSS